MFRCDATSVDTNTCFAAGSRRPWLRGLEYKKTCANVSDCNTSACLESHATSDFTLAYSAFPCAVLPPTGQKPLMPSSLRAFLHASIHFFSALVANFFLAAADAFLLTILPFLLFIRVAFVRPLAVFSLFPRKTEAFARLPLAILLTFMAFMPLFFMAFIAFIAFIPFFIAAFFMPLFIAFIVFMPFIPFFIAAFFMPLFIAFMVFI